MKWYQLPLGPLQTNCYIVSSNSGSCLIIDPGEEGKKVIGHLERQKLKPIAILLTHAHFDHIGAVDQLRDHYKIPVYLHEKESKWLMDPSLNGSKFFMIDKAIQIQPADYHITNEQEMTIEGFTFKIYETPGHSPGSVSFYFPDGEFVAAGDALFYRSIGRTDLPGGNHDQLINSIHRKLLVLPENTIVLPGHGPATTIMDEMDGNPFLNGF